MRKLQAFALVAALAVAITIPAVAQDAPEVQTTGRYQLFQAQVTEGDADTSVPMMIDTQYGRSWVLTKQDGSYVWKRIPVVKLGQMPDTLLSRPLAVTATPAPARK